MAKEVQLLRFWTSPFCIRVELALNLKGIEYEGINENYEMCYKHNPIYKEVPVLIHEDKATIGSYTIIEYIDEKWSDSYPILPKDPFAKAHARFYAKFIDEKLIPTLRNSFWSEGEMKETNMAEAKANLSILEKELKGNKFFGGESIGFLDIAAAYVAYWCGVFEEVAEVTIFTKEGYPTLWKWSEDFVSSDVAQKSLPDREKMVAFFHSIKSSMKDHYVKPAK